MSFALDANQPLGPGYSFPRVRRGLLAFTFSRQRVVEGLWVLFIMGALSATRLFNINNTERYAWLVADFVVLLLLLRDYRPLYTLAMRHKIFLAWPVLAMLSTLWSLAPAVTLYQGTQLLMTTLVSFMFCLQVPRGRMLVVVLAAMVACLISSIGFIMLYPWMGRDLQGAWMGVFIHKNHLGAVAAMGILTSTCLLLMGWRPRISVASLALSIFMLAMSRSATALLLTVIVLCLVVVAFCMRRGRNALSFGFGLLALAGSALLFYIVMNGINVFEVVLQGMGKDTTLTGRTILWDIGMRAFWQRPVLGHGYNGFWAGDPSTVGYLQFMAQQPLWFFHNNFIEMAVAFGVMGPVLLLAGIVYAVWVTVRNFLRDHRYSSVWCVLVVVYMTLDTMAEYPLFLNHSVWQFLFVAAVASLPVLPQRRSRHRNAYLEAQPGGAAP